MAYDEDLADRIRELVADEGDVLENRMFGGLAFLVGGNMPVARALRVDSWCASTATVERN